VAIVFATVVRPVAEETMVHRPAFQVVADVGRRSEPDLEAGRAGGRGRDQEVDLRDRDRLVDLQVEVDVVADVSRVAAPGEGGQRRLGGGDSGESREDEGCWYSHR
jgi:hypothetical protein